MPATQYRDYAIDQRHRHRTPSGQTAADEVPDPVELPLDRPRDRDQPRPARTVVTALPPRLTNRLAELRRAAGGTTFMLVVTALAGLLRRLDDGETVTIGTLAAGRTEPRLDELIGYFPNLLQLRIPVPRDTTFRQLWRQVRDECLRAYSEQDRPYGDGATATGHGTNRRALSVLCVAQPPAAVPNLPGLRVEAVDVPHPFAQFDLTIEIRELTGSLRLGLQYDASVLDDATVTLLARYLTNILQQIAENPDLPCRSVRLDHTPARPTAVSRQPGAVPPSPDGTRSPEAGLRYPDLAAAFEAQARRTPDAVAVAHRGTALTFRALNERANQWAHALLAAGVQNEDPVGVHLPRSPDAVAALLAVLKAGAAYLPLDPTYPQARLRAVLADAAAHCLITTGALAAHLGGVPRLRVDAGVAEWATQPRHDPGRTLTPEHLAYLMYTSGSTGNPRGVLGTHGALLRRLSWMWTEHPYAVGERAGQRTPLGFIDSLTETLGPLLAGVPIEIVDSAEAADPDRLAAALSRHQVTRLVVVPTLLRPLLDTGTRLPALRLCVTSGERLPAGLVRRFHQVLPGVTLLNLYGCTEVAGDATAGRIAPEDTVTIGRPITGVTTVVVDRDDNPAAALVPGDLLVGGATLARGYHARPGETADRFRPDSGTRGGRTFHTGDLARRRPDGQLVLLGRRDDQLKVRGVRVEPAEVEDALLAHPAVAEAVVAAVPDATGTETLVGYLVPAVDHHPDEVRAHLQAQLPAGSLPSLLIAVPELPRTPGGKVDRRSLPPPAATAAPVTAAALNGATERTVAEIFTELLPAGWRTANDDFFALGGHSITAVAVVTRLRRRFAVPLHLRDLVDAPTIATLARLIDTRRRPPRPREPGDAGAPGGSAGPAGGPPALEPRPGQHETFPLTEVQQAYWVGRTGELPLGNVSTHAYFELDLAGRLDVPRLEAAVRRLVDRHPALRTVVYDGGEQQVRADVPPYQIPVNDLRDLPAGTADARQAEVRAEMSHQVLDARTWPLFDIRVTTRATGTRVHVSIDALVADAYSVHLLTQELGQFYHRPETRLPPLRLTFRDVVVARREAQAGPEYQRALRYWQDRLSTLPPGPRLPLAAEPESVTRPVFRRLARRLDADTWQAFTDRAAAAGVTASVGLLTAFTTTLTAWSRTPHYTVMLTLFNRHGDHPDLHQIVGDFTSVAPLEVDQRAIRSFQDQARRLQHQLWTDLDHHAVSGVTVLREWNRRLGGPPRPLIPVVFTSNLGLPDPTPLHADPAPPLGEPGYGVTQTPQAYLDHQVAQTPDGLTLHWDAIADLFPDGVLDDMCDTYLHLLHDLATGRRSWAQPVRGLLPPPQRRHRATVNSSARPLSPATLTDLVAAAAAATPDAPAVITPDQRLTYRELTARAGRIAHWLRGQRAADGDLVGVVATKGWEQAVAALAVVAAGCAYLPLDPELPDQRMRLLADQTRLRYVLTQRNLTGRLAGLSGVAELAVDDAGPWAGQPPELPSGHRPDQLAYVIFTSGSTGLPKGVMIDHRGAVNTILDINRRFGVTADDRVLGLSALSFDLSVYDLFGSWAAGGAVVLPDPARLRDPGHWIDLVRRHRVTVWNSVPALMTLAVEHPAADAAEPGQGLAGLRLVLLSGDWIPPSLPDRVRRSAPDAAVISLGGATEASIWSVYHTIATVDPGWASIPYGRPLSNQRLHVLDADHEPRPDWVTGDLYIAGTGLARGYWNDPERATAQFHRHPRTGERLYRTGDLARYLPGGDLEFLGREDLQVKVNGYRVELGEIETALRALPGVADCAVTAVGRRDGDRRLAAYYVPATDRATQPATLLAALRTALPSYLVPGTLTALTALPVTGNGKVDRAALLALAAGRGDPAPPTPPATLENLPDAGMAAQIAQLWAAVLDTDDARPEANFFDLGGTSVVAMRLLAQLEQSIGARIPLLRLYEAPTLAELTAAVAAATATGPSVEPLPTVVPRPELAHEPFALTDIQQAYWLGRRTGMSLGGVGTHSYLELDVRDLDVDRLERALNHLVARHPALRTVVGADGTQRVLAEVPDYRVPRRDVRGRDHDILERLRAQLSHVVHDVTRWPSFAVAATRLDDNLTRLHLSVDLMIADAWSFHILRHDLLLLYAEPDADLPALTCTFRDYVVALGQLHRHPVRQQAQRYWRDRIPHLPPAPALPLTGELSHLERPHFVRVEDRLAPATWRALRAAAARHQLTPSGLLCAAFAEVLAMYTQKGRFTLNVTTFNRPPMHPEIDQVVGDFTATTLLAVDATAPTFARRAAVLQQQLFDDLQHRQVTGVEVLRLLRAAEDRRAQPVAPVVFTSLLGLEDSGTDTAALAWPAEPVYAISQTPQVLLDHQVSEHDGALVYVWDHVAEAFPDGLVATMFDGYRRLLHALTTDGGYWEVPPAWTL
ncbi:amino acid adenylation domain-containing protein [Micromonospora sp. NPDC051296]|uniref:amino acid adenylation domain-containing protein n=1 Tax=Micromonospora sp. NPDC051296 TaxID=3155046 RepID=UPI003412DBD0